MFGAKRLVVDNPRPVRIRLRFVCQAQQQPIHGLEIAFHASTVREEVRMLGNIRNERFARGVAQGTSATDAFIAASQRARGKMAFAVVVDTWPLERSC